MFTCYTMWKNTMVCLGLIDVLCIAYLPNSRQNCEQYQRHRTRTCVFLVSHFHSHRSSSKDSHPHSQLTDNLSVFFGRHVESGNVLITDYAQASTNHLCYDLALLSVYRMSLGLTHTLRHPLTILNHGVTADLVHISRSRYGSQLHS